MSSLGYSPKFGCADYLVPVVEPGKKSLPYFIPERLNVGRSRRRGRRYVNYFDPLLVAEEEQNGPERMTTRDDMNVRGTKEGDYDGLDLDDEEPFPRPSSEQSGGNLKGRGGALSGGVRGMEQYTDVIPYVEHMRKQSLQSVLYSFPNKGGEKIQSFKVITLSISKGVTTGY